MRSRALNIELHIEELALEGVAPELRSRVSAALERELTRLLAEEGLPSRLAGGGALARLDGGSFNVAPQSGPEAIGVAAARAVYAGMGR
jgi:hypothetical protein